MAVRGLLFELDLAEGALALLDKDFVGLGRAHEVVAARAAVINLKTSVDVELLLGQTVAHRNHAQCQSRAQGHQSAHTYTLDGDVGREHSDKTHHQRHTYGHGQYAVYGCMVAATRYCQGVMAIFFVDGFEMLYGHAAISTDSRGGRG